LDACRNGTLMARNRVRTVRLEGVDRSRPGPRSLKCNDLGDDCGGGPLDRPIVALGHLQLAFGSGQGQQGQGYRRVRSGGWARLQAGWSVWRPEALGCPTANLSAVRTPGWVHAFTFAAGSRCEPPSAEIRATVAVRKQIHSVGTAPHRGESDETMTLRAGSYTPSRNGRGSERLLPGTDDGAGDRVQSGGLLLTQSRTRAGIEP
jgi:hypothetical protein